MKKKGFTLVEIIISLVLIILIGTISIISLKKDNDEVITKSKEVLQNAGEIFIEEAISDKTYKSYNTIEEDIDTGTKETKTISCLSPETLIEKGYLTNDNEYYKYLINNNLYLKVISSSLGSVEYQEIPETEASCYIYKDETSFDAKDEIQSTGNLTEDGYEFKQYIEASPNANNYIYKLDYQFNLKSVESITIDIPLYVVIVLDESGSMSGTRWTNAKKAVETLSKKIIGLGTKNKVALVKFGKTYNKGSFSHSAILAKNISFASSSYTCYSCGLQGAYELLNASSFNISNKKKENSNFFVVFLSDGGDNRNTSSRTSYVNKIKNLITDEYGKLITVGYTYSSSILENMASSGCDTTTGKCYYGDKKTSEIEELFDSLASTMTQIAKCSKYKKAEIIVNLSTNFKSTDVSNPSQIKQIIDMECDDSTLEIAPVEIKNIEQNITYNPTASCSEDVCTITENIVDSTKGAIINFYDDKNKKVSSVTLPASQFPSVTLTLRKFSVIN